MSDEASQFESLLRIARQARIDHALLMECIERHLLPVEDDEWGDEAYLVACRVRRLSQLGVNIQGIEIALDMRQRLLDMQSELRSLRSDLTRLQRERDRELARLMRELAEES